MKTQFAQSGFCYSPLRGEGLVLRPNFWGQQHDSEPEKPFVSKGDERPDL